MTLNPTVSIIINTDGRAESLKLTLDSLRYLDYPTFEVCVVYGPTLDGTKELLEERFSDLKVAHCPTRNLSASRNIGIAMAAGEIIAFLDDDSIPEPEWLSLVVREFSEPDVAACGGYFLDNTGVGYQWRFGTVDRLGWPDTSWDRPPIEFNFPYTKNFPHIMANSAFRKSAVLSIGGFDEQYEYFLDETDLICRLVDHGWRIIPIYGAAVHHKFRPSHIRSQGVIKSWYAVVKSKIYFSLINSHGHHSLLKALASTLGYVDILRSNLEWGISEGRATDKDRERFDPEVDRALADGLTQGLAKARRLMDPKASSCYQQPFRPFEILLPSGGRKTVCLLTKTYPPVTIGGIGRLVHQLARSIATLGHQVHVLTAAADSDTVDFENGVWVHRIQPRSQSDRAPIDGLSVPQHIWNYSATMLAEARKVEESRAIDAVIAPIWDCEGLAFLMDGRFALITSLQTTLKFFLDSHDHLKSDLRFIASFAEPMMAVERLLFRRSNGIVAISNAIANEIEKAYDVSFKEMPLAVVPIGLEDWTRLDWEARKALPEVDVRILFVGRLEERKGIDVFLSALKQILLDYPRAHVDIVGNSALPGKDGRTYRELFELDAGADVIRNRVHFHGEVSDAVLRGFYRACDIFVAPSRFESFGLILLEAMMFAKPVIGCRAGGMVEVVEHGESGLLAEPGDAGSLAVMLRRLLDDAELRRRLGSAGRRRYETLFTPERMADGVLAIVARLSPNRSANPATISHRHNC